ncbi:hypothetical protein IW261DRAFT_1425522 [Armillaria novae-zelandiae]|uniref:Uncharacterized protein n=1 Tax=Armillaria novae-zelandiae TaxID=153914 RepID=A0AA39U9Y6_9AGAR|nr:hypothetical protein IW261DRAFT_1425522 [Armillaria novae-zelandiae]
MGAMPSKSLIVATDDTHRVLLSRQEVSQYDNLLSILQKHFPSMTKDSMIIQTDELEVCAGEYVDISGGLWPEMSLWVHSIRVISRPRPILKAVPLGQTMKILVVAVYACLTLTAWCKRTKRSRSRR